MSKKNPHRMVRGFCPKCGPSWISILEEGASYFIGISTPNWSCADWVGQCYYCHAYLETSFGDDREVRKMEWTPVDDEKIEFLFGNSSRTRTDQKSRRKWDSELDV
jgi:hypothetical protein